MSAKARKHTKKEEAMMNQMIQQIGPKTKLAKLTWANWNAEKHAGLSAAVDESSIVRIRLEQLDDSPYQLRHDIDQDELEELTRSIEEHGLLNPILVRRIAERQQVGYQVISGHRRTAAFRRLSFNAKNDEEKKKWDAIQARVLPSVSDDQVLLLGIAENMFRADISPMDAANGLVTLQQLKPALKSAPLIAAATGLQQRKVERLLRLAASPEVVQKAVQDGIKVPAEDKPKNDDPDDDSAWEQTRTLDLFSALEFNRLYQAVLKTGDNAKNGKKFADARTGTAIARALKENWGYRDVKQYVDKTVAQLDAPAPKNKGGRPAEPFKNTDRQLVIYKNRLGSLTALQSESLRKALEEVLRQLADKAAQNRFNGRARSRAPGRHAPTSAHRSRARKNA